MFTSLGDSLFVMPVCYHPTTVLSVDDDEAFLNILSLQLSNKLSLLCFSNPNAALEYSKNSHHYFPFTSRCLTDENDSVKFNFMSIRNEIYNHDRFKEIAINVTDYDMPHTSGIELIKTMEFQPEVPNYSHIILTGKISDEFKAKIASLGLSGEYIGKDDPDYVNKLLNLIEKRTGKIFQWASYVPARILSRNDKEKTSVLFDGNFATLFNDYVKNNNICEFYLFDKQGSYLFLDDEANLSWLFIRGEQGMANSIELAIHYGAPQSVIDALKSKEFILSLYEKEDFEKRKSIVWDDYLLPAKIFESDKKYLDFFPNLIHLTDDGRIATPKYYYAFTDKFPEHGIEKDKVLSYQTFLRELD
jgi:CheY-like chemotaxis protein